MMSETCDERSRVPGDGRAHGLRLVLLLWEGKVYSQTVPDVYVVGKAQPKPDGHVVVIARATIQDTRSRSSGS